MCGRSTKAQNQLLCSSRIDEVLTSPSDCKELIEIVDRIGVPGIVLESIRSRPGELRILC